MLRPLALKHTTFPGTDPAMPRPHAVGYSKLYAPHPGPEIYDATEYNPAWSGATGEMISILWGQGVRSRRRLSSGTPIDRGNRFGRRSGGFSIRSFRGRADFGPVSPPLSARRLTESTAHRDESGSPRPVSSPKPGRFTEDRPVHRDQASSPREPSSSRTRRWSLASASRPPYRCRPRPCGRSETGGITRSNNSHGLSAPFVRQAKQPPSQIAARTHQTEWRLRRQ